MSQAILAIPYVVAAWAIGAPVWTLVMLFVGPFLVIGAPLVAGVTWAVAKGSNWTNTKISAVAVAGYASLVYATFSVVLVAIRYGDELPGWFYAVAVVILALGRRLMLRPYAYVILRWLAPDLLPSSEHTTA